MNETNGAVTVLGSEELSLDEYQRKAMRTASGMTPAQMIENGCMGLAGEAGECIDLLKKAKFQGHELSQAALVNELGDVLWYVACTAAGLGVPLSLVAQRNVEKLLARYPEGFDPERSLHRDERLESAGFEI